MRLLLRVLFIATHASVLVLFAAGLLGRYVSPHTAWWLQPFAIVLPAIALVVMVLTPFAGVMRMWVLFAVSVALLVTFGLRYVAAADGGERLNGEALTVVTMNAGGGVNNLQGGDRGLPRLLPEVRPHVACLQEFSVGYRGNQAHTYSPVDELLESLGYEIIAPAPPEGHRRPPAVFSRVDFEQSSVIGLSSRFDRGPAGTVVRAQLSWQGRSFVVYNIHLQSFTTRRPWVEGNTFNLPAWIQFIRRTGAAFLQRADESVEIRAMLDGEELPFLLCGDFNTTPHQWTYWKLSSGLQDAYRTAGGFWGPTFPSAWPLVRIDYIIASPHWIVGDVEVGPQLPPDHRPVIGELMLPE